MAEQADHEDERVSQAPPADPGQAGEGTNPEGDAPPAQDPPPAREADE